MRVGVPKEPIPAFMTMRLDKTLLRPRESYHGGTGTPMVLIHGFSANWRCWQPVIAALEEHHEVYAINLPGHFEGAAWDEQRAGMPRLACVGCEGSDRHRVRVARGAREAPGKMGLRGQPAVEKSRAITRDLARPARREHRGDRSDAIADVQGAQQPGSASYGNLHSDSSSTVNGNSFTIYDTLTGQYLTGAYSVSGNAQQASFVPTAALANVPLAALVMVCEVAGSYDLLVPLMLTEGIAMIALRKVNLYRAQPRTTKDSPVHDFASQKPQKRK